ncbi:MAG: 23S rRNA (uracil(1939)-C(5))-methyltransferase RlmD [Elainellaceae cyanobacterium]
MSSSIDEPISATPTSASEHSWRQGAHIAVDIHDLSNRGDGVGRWGDRIVFVPDTVPGDRVDVRLTQVKPSYANATLQAILQPSSQRVRPGCIVADKCGGCQWQAVAYAQQLNAKRDQIGQALERIGGLPGMTIHPVMPSEPFGYRNKATYPLGRSSSTGQVQAGYYQKRSHKLVNLNQCPVQDERFNPLMAGVKQDIQKQGWSIYSETRHQGRLRHLSLRIGRRTGEMLLTLVSTEAALEGLEAQAQEWIGRYPGLVGVCLNLNPARTNAIFGAETRCIAGQPFLTERFAGLTFQVTANTFFQVNTEQAEVLLQIILDELHLSGNEVLVDAYCGIGTLTLPLAKHVKQAIAIESQAEAVQQAQVNAALNGVDNAAFHIGDVGTLLPQIQEAVDVVVLDPPRKGCDKAVLDGLLAIAPTCIVYVSCNPATLARDLKALCGSGEDASPPLYRVRRVQPVDFFPQTAHVECAVFLERISS